MKAKIYLLENTCIMSSIFLPKVFKSGHVLEQIWKFLRIRGSKPGSRGNWLLREASNRVKLRAPAALYANNYTTPRACSPQTRAGAGAKATKIKE